jgi:hypothetical protein
MEGVPTSPQRVWVGGPFSRSPGPNKNLSTMMSVADEHLDLHQDVLEFGAEHIPPQPFNFFPT